MERESKKLFWSGLGLSFLGWSSLLAAAVTFKEHASSVGKLFSGTLATASVALGISSWTFLMKSDKAERTEDDQRLTQRIVGIVAEEIARQKNEGCSVIEDKGGVPQKWQADIAKISAMSASQGNTR